MKFSIGILLALGFCLQLFGNDHDNYTFIDNYLQKSESFFTINQDSVLNYANKAYDLASELKVPDKKVDALFLKVRSSIILNDYSGAYDFCTDAQKIVTENELTNKQPEVYMYQGLVYQVMGLTSEALKQFFTSTNKSHYET